MSARLEFPDLIAEFGERRGYEVEADDEGASVLLDIGDTTHSVYVHKKTDRVGREFVSFWVELRWQKKQYVEDVLYFLDFLSTGSTEGRFYTVKRTNPISHGITYEYTQLLAGVTDYDSLLENALSFLGEEIANHFPIIELVVIGKLTYEQARKYCNILAQHAGNA